MARAIAIISLLAVFVSVPMVVLRPKWVFYIFVISSVFGNILGSYVYEAGALGMPRAWQPADFLAWLTLVAALFVGHDPLLSQGIIKKCVVIIVILSGLSLLQGLILYFHTALTYSRQLHFVASMVFAYRYFTTKSRVNKFLNFTAFLLLVVFVFQVCIRFGVYTPPAAYEQAVGQLLGERGEASFGLVIYLALIAIAVGRLSTRIRPHIISVIFLIVGLAGAILSETRVLQASIVVQGIASLLLLRGRLRASVMYGIAALLFFYAAQAIGFDIFARFREHGRIVSPFAAPTLRMMEYPAIVKSYATEPYFILTGRGVGAMHTGPGAEFGQRGYYHSEFLGWLDKFGLIGLFTMIIMLLACSWRGFRLARSDIPYLQYYGSTVFLLTTALFAQGVFSPNFLLNRAGSLLICFVAIVANWQSIYESIYEEQIAL
ncbi:MAG: hypothetical protein KAV87_32775, partial [Desulfobacteraceae bacterium]|nr:hypothetical protein [Desulfobacteraceae bacterium]